MSSDIMSFQMCQAAVAGSHAEEDNVFEYKVAIWRYAWLVWWLRQSCRDAGGR